MEYKCDNADNSFNRSVGENRNLKARREAARQQRADRHPAHENDEHQGLRVGRMTQEQLEVV